VVIRMRKPGNPRTSPSISNGMASAKSLGGDMIALTMRTTVREIAAGNTTVPMRSVSTTNCILKQNVPHKLRTRTSSMRLCSVEFIHLRLWDNRTLKEEGMTVLQTACGQNIILRWGKLRSISVLRNRSSPRRRRFFWWRVSTTDSEYSWTISGLRRIGTHFSAPSASRFRAFNRYIEKLD